MQMTEQMTRVVRARIKVGLTNEWFAPLVLKLRPVEVVGFPHRMATDGTVIIFNPEEVAKWSDPEVQAVVAHEVFHPAFGDLWRENGRDHDLWNCACDYWINARLRKMGFTLPEPHLYEARFDNDDLSKEGIYEVLRKERDQQPDAQGAPGQGGGQGAPQPGKGQGKSQAEKNDAAKMGGFTAPGALSEGEGEGEGDKPKDGQQGEGEGQEQAPTNTEADWRMAVEAATAVAQKRGTMPAGMDRLVREARESRTDWRTILRRFIENTVPADYSWSQPNRRYVSSGLYLPGVYKENVARIGIGVDTSGSIDQAMLDVFCAEVKAIMYEARPSEMEVVYADAKVAHIDTFTPDGEEVVLRARGGGGTSFRPALAHFSEQDEPPVAVVYCTDGFGDRPEEPGYPVLWVLPAGCKNNTGFGESITIEVR